MRRWKDEKKMKISMGALIVESFDEEGTKGAKEG